MPRLTATNAGLSISGRQTSQFAATGKPLPPKDEPAPQLEPQPNVYRKNKKRDTVEFTPARSGNAPCRSLGLPPAAKRNPLASRS